MLSGIAIPVTLTREAALFDAPQYVWVVSHEQGNYSDREFDIIGVARSRLDGMVMAEQHVQQLHSERHARMPESYDADVQWHGNWRYGVTITERSYEGSAGWDSGRCFVTRFAVED